MVNAKNRKRREFLKGLITGLFAGATGAIPAYFFGQRVAEEMFRKELNNWILKYRDVLSQKNSLSSQLKELKKQKEMLRKERNNYLSKYKNVLSQKNSLSSQVKKLEEQNTLLFSQLEELKEKEEMLQEELNNWTSKYNDALSQLEELKELNNSLSSQIETLDKLEIESTNAIKNPLDKALEELAVIIKKYEPELGRERLLFEIQTRDILKNLNDQIKVLQAKLYWLDQQFPIITGVSYIPYRVVNDKIYDIKVKFSLIDPFNEVKKVRVEVIPVVYEYLPEEAFPYELPKIMEFDLTPSSDVERVFTTPPIKNLKGGREYFIKVSARDSAGNVREKRIKTPYIREFENIAPLNNILVGAYYYPWYNPRHWREGHIREPLLGEYNSQDSIVISKHIDWATGHGIDFFLISWWGPFSFEDETIRYYFLNNPLVGDIKFCILYESEGRFGRSKEGRILIDPEILKSDFQHMKDYFFDNPQYLKVENKPVVFMYLSRDYVGDIEQIFRDIRESYNPWLLGDHAYWGHPLGLREDLMSQFDGISTYTWAIGVPELMKKDKFIDRVMEKMEMWKSIASDYGVKFIPGGIMPGFNDDAIGGTYPNIERDTEFFETFFTRALAYLDANLRAIIVTSFNEWHEDTEIEPAKDYGYEYLKVLYKNLLIYY